MFLATSGLRTGEVTGLEMDDVDFDKRKVIPNHESTTKRSYVTFYNDETEEALNKYLPKRKDGDSRIFQVSSNPLQKSFRKTSERSGVKITPKTLRKWFAKEMRNLGVSGEHIDAFAGRLPQSVRAKHYTSYSPERLKEIYTRADIKVLN
ncbi:hypothetical protein AKJ38_03135 [candidate division MSBL1 archaeon SCGC-AAA259I14]|uniref:Tyr recombinase domain-containing protein n=1 Tax=candidate division MSBL1 archaeon SCGC-AAA259I14 TaxID=1698268 RepID=A0A133UQL6_9EURY|nr:hypothetical protein AKJ38_03135 [candidate division MSBL1 archaeon SCGC-AAA259I14]